VIINFFMTKDPLFPRKNKVNWHYVRDDQMFTTIKLVSRHQNTQQFGVMLPVEVTNEDIRNSTTYKEYYAITSRAAPPKTKASVRKTQSSSETTMPPPTAANTRLLTSAKGSMQQTHISQASGSGVDERTENNGDDFVHPKLSTHDEEAKDEKSFDLIVQIPSQLENSVDGRNGDEGHGMNVEEMKDRMQKMMMKNV
nr:hypothetical protein [Tanacetum cinerariifolium]